MIGQTMESRIKEFLERQRDTQDIDVDVHTHVRNASGGDGMVVFIILVSWLVVLFIISLTVKALNS